jgi:hypothetical protein
MAAIKDHSTVHPHQILVQRVRNATNALLGQQVVTHQISEWCDQCEQQCDAIQSSRGVSMVSIAVVGAKGQGKTWVARQMIQDKRVAKELPSGVLSSEATTHLHWIGPAAPDAMDAACEQYHACRTENMLDLGHVYMLLDTPGITDDNPQAAKIARDALALSPIKLLIVRRDQLRGAVVSQLANYTEGAICIPIVTCVPLNDLVVSASIGNANNRLKEDMDVFCDAMRASAPRTKFLEPVWIADFEADGNESKIGSEFALQLKARLKSESMEDIAATRANRMAAAMGRLRRKIHRLLESQLPQLSAAVSRLRSEADALPSQAIEAVLGSKLILQSAVRGRVRAQMISETSMLWFPFRTVLTILGLTNGAWDRLLLSLSGSVPSIFGTFAAWARNVQQSKQLNWEMNDGIRDRLNRQIQDRLEPIQAQFHRVVRQLRGSADEPSGLTTCPSIRLTGVEELQSRSRTVFEWSVDRNQNPWILLQFFGLIGTCIFWLLMSGPIITLYRQYLLASYDSLTGVHSNLDAFPHPTGALFMTSLVLSLIPLLVFSMLILSWNQRGGKIRRIAEGAYSDELKLVHELQQTGVVSLHYDDLLLEHAEFLVQAELK